MLTQEQPTIQVCSESTPKIWDRATGRVNVGDRICVPFTPIMEVVDKDVYPNGQIWLLVKPNSGSYTEEWLLDAEDDIQQPAETQPLFEEEEEFKQGFQHGQYDADKRLPRIYTQASCQYSVGYVQGYNTIHNPQQAKAPAAPPTWSVTYSDKWQWYVAWVGNRAIGRASTHEEAERIGQKYIATGRLWQEHRERVLASYAH